MSFYILTSMFAKTFPNAFAEELYKIIKKNSKFVFITSEFEKDFEKNDWYFTFFLEMFTNAGIDFSEVSIIDARLTKEQMHNEILSADVIWLAGGDTLAQYQYLRKYELISLLKDFSGIVIGMSAGSINMGKTAICTIACGHDKQEIYEGLGFIEYSVEPHFEINNVSSELLSLSHIYTIYGISDESAVIASEGKIVFIGDVYLLNKGEIHKLG